MVDVLLSALGLVAGSQESASGVRGSASLQPGGLGVVVLSVAVFLGDVLEDNAPETLNVDSAPDLGVVDVGRAEVTLRPDPVGSVVRGRSLGSSGVVAVVEGVLLILGDVFDEVVGTLVGDVRVLLEEDRVVADLGGDLVFGVFGIDQAEGEVGVDGTGRRDLGVTIGGRWGWAIGRWGRTVGQDDRERNNHGKKLKWK